LAKVSKGVGGRRLLKLRSYGGGWWCGEMGGIGPGCEVSYALGERLDRGSNKSLGRGPGAELFERKGRPLSEIEWIFVNSKVVRSRGGSESDF